MKNALLTCCVLPLFLLSAAEAGINGTYKVRGTETSDGEKLKFAGTVTISNYKTASYSLDFNDGEGLLKFKFSFDKRLKETNAPQTVKCSSSLGTGTATFRYVNKHKIVEFTYKAKGEDIRGSGKGSK